MTVAEHRTIIQATASCKGMSYNILDPGQENVRWHGIGLLASYRDDVVAPDGHRLF